MSRSTLDRTLAGLCWSATAATCYRGIRGTLRVRSSLAWLRAPGREGPPAAPLGDSPRFVLLLPMLREQRIIADAVAAFCELARAHSKTSVVLVTTERERAEQDQAAARLPELARALTARTPIRQILNRFLGVLPRDRLERLACEAAGGSDEQCLAAGQAALAELPTTEELAAKLATGAADGEVEVRHYHCPDSDGTMAHQINYAGAAELARLARAGIDAASVFLAVYNADSRPEPATLHQVASTIGRLARTQGGAPRVLQQSALFTGNLDDLGGGLSGSYLAGAALLQTRWSLAHEIPTWRRQSGQARAVPGLRRRLRLAHCTGHGLFIRGDEFLRWGGLPTATMNEDLAFGFLLSAAGVPIDPVPALEWAHSPEAVTHVLRQKRQWFWSYVEYPQFARMATDQGLADRRHRAGLVAQGLARGLAWLGTSPAVGATLALPLVRRHPSTVILSAAALAVYYVLPFRLIAAELRHRGQRSTGLRAREAAGGLAAYLTHSVGPAWCLANAANRALTRACYTHDKTER